MQLMFEHILNVVNNYFQYKFYPGNRVPSVCNIFKVCPHITIGICRWKNINFFWVGCAEPFQSLFKMPLALGKMKQVSSTEKPLEREIDITINFFRSHCRLSCLFFPPQTRHEFIQHLRAFKRVSVIPFNGLFVLMGL